MRWLYLTIACLVAILFAGNYAALKSQARCPQPGNCQCVVTLSRDGTSASTDPSCSVTWALGGHTGLSNCDIVEPGFFDSIIKCDTGKKARLKCRGGEFVVRAGTATRLSCDESGDYPTIKATHDDSWVNNVGGHNTNAQSVIGRWMSRIRAAVSDEQRHRILTETEAITVINGDAGITMENGRPRVMVTAGEALVESFCNGSVQRIAAPALVMLPNIIGETDLFGGSLGRIAPCAPDDLSGRWRGFLDRMNRDGSIERVPLVLDIREKAGTVETPEGVLDIADFSIGNGSLSLRAKARSGTGELAFEGTFDKGGMSVTYRESGMGSDGKRSGTGTAVAERLYIAQWAVSKAALDTPYQHSLIALSPAGGSFTWSVVDGELPDGLALDGATGAISGTATTEGEHKFTVEVRDSAGDTFRQPLSLRVAKLVLATPLVPSAFIGQEYKFKLELAGGQPPYSWRNYLSLPFAIPGMPALPQVSQDGEITYQPTEDAGLLMLTATDSGGASQRMAIALDTRGVSVLGSALLPPATAGAPYTYKFQSAGHRGDVAWADADNDLDGTGLQLDSQTGELSGTPSAAGIITLRVSAEDEEGEDSRPFLLAVEEAQSAAGETCATCASRKHSK